MMRGVICILFVCALSAACEKPLNELGGGEPAAISLAHEGYEHFRKNPAVLKKFAARLERDGLLGFDGRFNLDKREQFLALAKPGSAIDQLAIPDSAKELLRAQFKDYRFLQDPIDETTLLENLGYRRLEAIGRYHKENSGPPKDIALGVEALDTKEPLVLFAKSVNALDHHEWHRLYQRPEGDAWEAGFKVIVDRVVAEGGKIHFSLTNMNVKKAMEAPEIEKPEIRKRNFTDYELQRIVRNPHWFQHTVFYKDGRKLSAEEAAALGIRPQ